MGGACGVIGYQMITYIVYGNWPEVPFGFVFNKIFGEYPVLRWAWPNHLIGAIGNLPVSIVGFLTSFVLLLISDLLRGDARRRS